MPEIKSTIKALEQGRASFAYDCVESVLKENEKIQGKYKSHVKKISPLILTNGLGLTLAFVKAKGKSDKGWDLVLRHITNWLKRDEKAVIKLGDKDDLVEKIIEQDSYTYRAVTVEVMAFINWLSRFAEGLIEKEEDTSD